MNYVTEIKNIFLGKSVNETQLKTLILKFFKSLKDQDINEQKKIDQILLRSRWYSENKKNLGANAILSCLFSCFKSCRFIK